jgi:hypothetical protein
MVFSSVEGRPSDSCGYDGRMNGHILIDGCDDLSIADRVQGNKMNDFETLNSSP